MKLTDICRLFPDIFISLSIEQQQACLKDAGFKLKLYRPVTSFSICQTCDTDDVYSFGGLVHRSIGVTRKTITYHGDGFSFLFDN